MALPAPGDTIIAVYYTLTGRTLLPTSASDEKLPPQGVHTALLARFCVFSSR